MLDIREHWSKNLSFFLPQPCESEVIPSSSVSGSGLYFNTSTDLYRTKLCPSLFASLNCEFPEYKFEVPSSFIPYP